MGPPLCGRPQTEVILLAIAVAKGLRVESPDGVQAVASNIHRKTDGCRNLHRASSIGSLKGGVQHREVAPKRQGPSREGGITANCRVVGEGCNRADALANI